MKTNYEKFNDIVENDESFAEFISDSSIIQTLCALNEDVMNKELKNLFEETLDKARTILKMV